MDSYPSLLPLMDFSVHAFRVILGFPLPKQSKRLQDSMDMLEEMKRKIPIVLIPIL